jgi:5-formyltetrahydrofolate cyclo-ligase
MAESSIGEKKRAMRSAALSRRNLLGREDFLTAGGWAQARALEFAPYTTAHAIALYSSIQNEVPTDRIREHALMSGKRVFFPKLTGVDSVDLSEIQSAADLTSGCFGMSEPVGPPALLPAHQQAAVVFVPGVAFDSSGNRLGRGIGWYDRLLKKIGRTAVFAALAYEFQIVAEVPTEPWDEQVDYIITEKRIIDCRTTPSRATAVS